MLGVSTEVYVTPVQGVTNYSLRRVILIVTSRVSTWARNRTPALAVIRSFHGKLTSTYTAGQSIRVRKRSSAQIVVKAFHSYVILIDISRARIMMRNRTPVVFVVKILHRKQTSTYTSWAYTRERNPMSVLCAAEGLVRVTPLDDIFGVYTTVRRGTNVLIVVKLLPVSRV